MTSTVSLRNFAKRVEDIELGNDWVPHYMSLPVDKNFKQCVKLSRQEF